MTNNAAQPNFNFRNSDEANEFYQTIKFDIHAEGFKFIDKQVLTPAPRCAFCDKSISNAIVKGVKVNDNIAKTQVIGSICEKHAIFLNKIHEQDIELAETQQMIRFFFPESGETIIRQQYMAKDLNEYDPLYLEYWALIKWNVEETILMKITDSKHPVDTPGYTLCQSNSKCVICGADESCKRQIFSPIKECWMEMEVCKECDDKIGLELRDMEFEIRTLYFEKFETLDDLPKRQALKDFTKAMTQNTNKVIFMKPRLDIEQSGSLLSIVGIDKEHSLLQKPAEIEKEGIDGIDAKEAIDALQLEENGEEKQKSKVEEIDEIDD